MSEKDDFWNLQNLIPTPKKTGLSKFATKPTTSEVTIESQVEPSPEKDRKLDFSAYQSASADIPDETYVPEGNPWIKKVTIRHDKGRFDFYDSFRRSAELYFDVEGRECPFVAFYSYMPQYAQMNKAQKEYYFYFRTQIRHGNIIKTDYSYLYLFVYEIINLPEKFKPEIGVDLLCNLWVAYRKSLPNIDKYFSVWIQDYCLIYKLPSPTEKLRSILPSVLPSMTFREFYLVGNDCEEQEVTSLLHLLSDYDWRAGRYAEGENAEVYKNHVIHALRPVLDRIISMIPKGAESLLVREAFPCSLCTHKVKSRLEIVYTPIASSCEIRNAVTSAVRYTENCLRSFLGVKSRLSVKDISTADKELIDSYFSGIFQKINEQKQKENIPAYEKMYDAPKEKLSLSGAAELENHSWDNTMKLIDLSDAEEINKLSEEEHQEPNSTAELDNYGLSETEIRFIESVFCKSSVVSLDRMEQDTMAEHINEVFAERFGDIIFELGAEKIMPIEDYREDVVLWLRNILK